MITFHSLEDRIVKRFIQQQERGGDIPAEIPLTKEQLQIRMRRIGGAIRPDAQEIIANPRARSATLRMAEKLQ